MGVIDDIGEEVDDVLAREEREEIEELELGGEDVLEEDLFEADGDKVWSSGEFENDVVVERDEGELIETVSDWAKGDDAVVQENWRDWWESEFESEDVVVLVIGDDIIDEGELIAAGETIELGWNKRSVLDEVDEVDGDDTTGVCIDDNDVFSEGTGIINAWDEESLCNWAGLNNAGWEMGDESNETGGKFSLGSVGGDDEADENSEKGPGNDVIYWLSDGNGISFKFGDERGCEIEFERVSDEDVIGSACSKIVLGMDVDGTWTKELIFKCEGGGEILWLDDSSCNVWSADLVVDRAIEEFIWIGVSDFFVLVSDIVLMVGEEVRDGLIDKTDKGFWLVRIISELDLVDSLNLVGKLFEDAWRVDNVEIFEREEMVALNKFEERVVVVVMVGKVLILEDDVDNVVGWSSVEIVIAGFDSKLQLLLLLLLLLVDFLKCIW